uniref:Uncharacterized protein n=1 Tax=Glossina austeni TaxID=7395 RepID=A0A1A9VAJ2_GLOAU
MYSYLKQAMLLRNYATSTCQSTGSADDWQIYCRYRNKAKKTIRKERSKYSINVLVGMDSSNLLRMFRGSGYIKGNDSPFRFLEEEVNDHLVDILNCDLPVDSEPWTNLNFHGTFSFSCVPCQELNAILHKIKSKPIGYYYPILFLNGSRMTSLVDLDLSKIGSGRCSDCKSVVVLRRFAYFLFYACVLILGNGKLNLFLISSNSNKLLNLFHATP